MEEANDQGLIEWIITAVGGLIRLFFWFLFSAESPLAIKIVGWLVTIWVVTAAALYLLGESLGGLVFVFLVILCIFSFV